MHEPWPPDFRGPISHISWRGKGSGQKRAFSQGAPPENCEWPGKEPPRDGLVLGLEYVCCTLRAVSESLDDTV